MVQAERINNVGRTKKEKSLKRFTGISFLPNHGNIGAIINNSITLPEGKMFPDFTKQPKFDLFAWAF
jgi:hypothetical protein